MKDVMGIIYTSREELSLRELTSKRSVAALPVAARYRLVDFLISSMVNSGHPQRGRFDAGQLPFADGSPEDR